MIRLMFSVIVLCAGLVAQCNPGTHPAGIRSGLVAGLSSGCNEISIDGVPHFSMLQSVRETGGPWTFTWLNPPHTGALPAQGVAVIGLSIAILNPGVQVSGVSVPCAWNVPLDTVFHTLVNFNQGCQSSFLFVAPPIPGLAGFQFYAQGGALDLTQNKWVITRPIEVTVQP